MKDLLEKYKPGGLVRFGGGKYEREILNDLFHAIKIITEMKKAADAMRDYLDARQASGMDSAEYAEVSNLIAEYENIL